MIPTRSLADVTSKIGSGATPRGGRSVYEDSGIAFIRSQNVVDWSMKLVGIARINGDSARELVGVTIKRGDVLINITGDSIARCTVVDPSVLPARVSQHVAILRPGEELDPGYLMAYLINPAMKSQLLTHSAGGTRNALTKAKLSALAISVPPIGTQRAIAAVFGALDDKIAANTAVASIADELARARFEAMPRTTATPLVKVAKFTNGKAFTKGASGSGRVVIRIAELNSGLGGSTVYNDIGVADDHLARPGDLLFAWSGSLTVHRWYRPEAIINQHIFKVIPRDGYPMWLAHQALLSRLEEFKAIAADKATTMGHIQRRHLEEVVAMPSAEHVAAETDLMDGLWRIALSAEQENLTLAELRDTLLPALMSGRLRVRDAERQVEDAV